MKGRYPTGEKEKRTDSEGPLEKGMEKDVFRMRGRPSQVSKKESPTRPVTLIFSGGRQVK